jgi:predicted transglutaminase-like cysteine proteinase
MPGGRLLMALVTLVCAFTSAIAAPRLVASRPAPALIGWTAFCEQNALECGLDLAEPEIIALDSSTLELIEAVNRHVNRTIAPRRDLDHWGKIEQWDLPRDGEGDCEDYQLLKRKLLVEAGVPRRAMRMTVVIDGTGAGHAVLTVRTDRADLILDNNTDAVLPWHELGYRFIQRESAHAIGWLFLELEPAPLVVAAR